MAELEADEIDIDTKFAGRIAKLFADEGDMVKAGPSGRADGYAGSRSLAEEVRSAGAPGAADARRGEGEPRAAADPGEARAAGTRPHQRPSTEGLCHGRAARPAPQQLRCSRRRGKCGDRKGRRGASTRSTPQRTMSSSTRSISPTTLSSRRERARSNTASPMSARCSPLAARSLRCSTPPMSTWTSTCRPRRPAGSSSGPMPASFSMPIPRTSIPAKVVFIASQAQFTPKTVETKDERDKLMFRIRVRIDPGRLRGRAELVEAVCPGSPMCAPIRMRVAASAASDPLHRGSHPHDHARGDPRRTLSMTSRIATARQSPSTPSLSRLPARLSSRADRARWRRQVVAARHRRRRPADPIRHG